MKFTAKNSDVQGWIEPAIIVATVGTQSDYPDTGRVTLTVTSNGIVSTANNGNAAITTKACKNEHATFVTEGEVTVRAEDLNNTLNAFEKEDNLVYELKGNEFTVTLEKDVDVNMSLPTESRAVVVPKQAETFDKEASVKKDIFIKLMEKVIFAIGYEQRRPEFLYWMLRLYPDKARSVCGNGNRFSVYDIAGKGLFKTSKHINVLFFKEHNSVLDKLLPLNSSDDVTIKEYQRNQDDDPCLNQTVVDLGHFTLMLLGHNPGLKWIDENKFLGRENPKKFVTKASEWDGAIKSINATINKYVTKQNLHHWTTIGFNSETSIATVNTSVQMKANRKVQLSDGNDKLSFKCLSKFLVEVLEQAAPDSNIQWEFVDSNNAVVVRFYAGSKIHDGVLESVNTSAGITESHAMFFAPFNKE